MQHACSSGREWNLNHKKALLKATITQWPIGMKPWMDRLEGTDTLQEWFADDAACLGELLLQVMVGSIK